MLVVSRFLSSFGFLLAALDILLSDILESIIFLFAIIARGTFVSDYSSAIIESNFSLDILATFSKAIGFEP